MNRLLIFKLYIKKYILLLVIFLLLIFSFNKIMLPKINGLDINYIEPNLIYYQGEDLKEYEDYAKNNNLDYSLSPNIKEKKDNNNKDEIIDTVYLEELNYLKETTQETIKKNLDYINIKNEKFIDIGLLYNFFPKEINRYKTKNYYLGVDDVITGMYPISENEIMIPEDYAIYLSNLSNFKNYDQLLNKEILIKIYDKEETFKIVGIYHGKDNFIIYPSNKNKENYNDYNSIFINFRTKEEKKQFYKNFDSKDYINTGDFILTLIIKILPIVFNLFLLTIGFLFIIKENKKYIYILNHYNYSKLNYIMPVIIPISIIIILLYLF